MGTCDDVDRPGTNGFAWACVLKPVRQSSLFSRHRRMKKLPGNSHAAFTIIRYDSENVMQGDDCACMQWG